MMYITYMNILQYLEMSRGKFFKLNIDGQHPEYLWKVFAMTMVMDKEQIGYWLNPKYKKLTKDMDIPTILRNITKIKTTIKLVDISSKYDESDAFLKIYNLKFNISHLDHPHELKEIQSAANKVFKSKSSYQKCLETLLFETYRELYDHILMNESAFNHSLHILIDDINTVFYQMCYDQIPLISASTNNTIRICNFLLYKMNPVSYSNIEHELDLIHDCTESIHKGIIQLNGIKWD